MNKHLKDGDLRAALDGELEGAGIRHLESCPLCKARQEGIRSHMQQTARGLSFLNAPAQINGLAAKTALNRFHTRTKTQKEISMFKKLLPSPLLRVGLANLLI